MTASRTPVRVLWAVHTLHGVAEHVRSDPKSLTLQPPSHRLSLPLNTPPFAVLPVSPGTIAFPPPLHPSPHHHSQPHQSEDRHTNHPEDCQAGHWNLAIACAAPVAYAPNNASKYGALSGATCTNA